MREQPGRRSTRGQIRVQQDQLRGAAPTVVAVSAEPVTGSGSEPPSVIAPARQQRDLGPGQVNLAQVLPAAISPEQLGGVHQCGIGLVRKSGSQQYPRAVQVGDALLGLAVQLHSVMHQPEGSWQVAGGELEAAEVVQGYPLGVQIRDVLGALDGASEISACRADLPHLDVKGPSIEQEPNHVDTGDRHLRDRLVERGLGITEPPTSEEDQRALAGEEADELGVVKAGGPVHGPVQDHERGIQPSDLDR